MHRIVGLDVSADAVRLVALESGFRGFQVVQMSHAPLAARQVAEGAEAAPDTRLRDALQALSGGQPLGPDVVAVALPGALVASFPMSLPFVDSRRIEQVLPAEVESAIPFDLDEVVWDYAVLSQEGGKSELIVGVVRKTALRELLAMLTAAGIDPKVVTFAPLALAALGEKKLLASLPDSGDRTEPNIDIAAVARGEPQLVTAPGIALLEAGPDRANFCILRAGKTDVARSLPTSSAAAWEAAAQDNESLGKLLAPLARDLKITLRTRAGRKETLPTRMLLDGQIADLPGAREWLSADLQILCEPLELTPEAQPPGAADPSSYALALGLALRAQHPRGRINFRKDEFAFTKDVSHVRGQFARLAVAVAAVLVLALVSGIARVSALEKQGKAYDDALCKATEQILRKCYTDYREALGALRGSNSRAGGIPRVSGTEILAAVTNVLPPEALPQLEDVEVTTTRVTLKGTVDGFDKVAPITSALKKDHCFGDIRPARTEKVANSQRVSFVIDFAYTCSGESAGGA